MDRLPHGYTNATRRLPDGAIEKRYEGPGRFDRAHRERICLQRLRDQLPVPEILIEDREVPLLVLAESPGEHGQDLIESGKAREVLIIEGDVVRRLQNVSPDVVTGLNGDGSVIVHGDFGPQNMRLDIDAHEPRAVLDWEFAHVGEPVEDVAWAEWIIRMHHPTAIDHLPAFYSAAGLVFAWEARRTAMLSKCAELLALCERGASEPGVALWRARLEVTERWSE